MWIVLTAAVPRHKYYCIHGGTQHVREPAWAWREPGLQGRVPCASRGCWLGFLSGTVSVPMTNFCGELQPACENRNKKQAMRGFHTELSAYCLVNLCML